MPEFLNIELMNWEDFWDLIIKAVFNTLVVLYLVRVLYYKVTPRKDFLFTYIMISQVVYFMLMLLENVGVNLGFALGLFAIFGMLRYRTRQIPIREMTYLFLVIGISVINALSNRKVSYAELLFTNVALIAITYLLENQLIQQGQAFFSSIVMWIWRQENAVPFPGLDLEGPVGKRGSRQGLRRGYFSPGLLPLKQM